MKKTINLNYLIRRFLLGILWTAVIQILPARNLPKEIETACFLPGGVKMENIFTPGNPELLSAVTCNISLSTGGSPAGAIVSLTGQYPPNTVYNLTVPESGIVVFAEVVEGNYLFEAARSGFNDYLLSTDISGNTVFNILLAEIRYKPLNFNVDSLALVATWDGPQDIVVSENFEGEEFPPVGWQAITQNVNGWYATDTGSSGGYEIPSHSTYAVANDDVDNGNGCCDYLITPEMNLTNLPDYQLNFSSYYTGAYSQKATIEISTDGGSTWTVIYTLTPCFGYWQELNVDLSDFSGSSGLSNLKIAFHADDQGEWSSGWAVDDLKISSGIVLTQGYGVFLDGILVDNTIANTTTLQNLNYGQEYMAGVAALYSSGYSEQDTCRFVSAYLSPPLGLQGENPANTDYAHLWWEQPVNLPDTTVMVPGLLGYNIYRNNNLLAFVQHPVTEYFDLALIPGFYNYQITAVYDLAFYGFPGLTGESMIEGPVEVAFICCNGLPFAEDFNTGFFETNQWTVDGNNWRISGQTGNDAPSAEFYFDPATTGYSLSLTSFFIIGTDMVDGAILLDFDLKHTLVNPTGNEFLAVEIFDGSAWQKVAEYNNSNSFDWIHKSIKITHQARGNIFNVRFRAHGANTLDIFNWMIDNIQIYRYCVPPYDLYASINFPSIDEVILYWEAPLLEVGEWLKWDNGTNYDAIGLTDGGTFSVASRFTPAQLGQYAGTSLTKIRLFPYAAGGIIVLKVWTGANAGQLVLSQPVASYTPGEWNEFILNTPLLVTGNTELWIGYTVTHGADYIAGIDAGPAVAGFGDMISIDGLDWESMATAYSINFNWNLQGFFESIDGITALAPITDNTVYGPASQLVRGNLPMLPNATVMNTVSSGSRGLVGYNIWRNDVFLDSTSETEYIDSSFPYSMSLKYEVTAVYEDCESIASNEVWVFEIGVPKTYGNSILVYPNPSNSVVNIELTNDISRVVVYNYVGQVIFEENVTSAKTIQLNVRNYESGAYLVKFVTNAGESFTKKVVVTK